MTWLHRCRQISSQTSYIQTLSLSLDETTLAVGRDNGNIELWKTTPNFFCQRVIPHSSSGIRKILFANSDQIVVVSLDGYVRTWSISGIPTLLLSFSSGGGSIWDAEFDASGNFLAVCCEDGTVRIFDSAFILKGVLKGATQRLLAVSWSKNSSISPRGTPTIWASSYEGKVFGWDIAQFLQDENSRHFRAAFTSVPVSHITITKGFAWCIVTTPNNEIITGNSNGKVAVWDQITGTLIQTLVRLLYDVISVQLSGDLQTLIAAGVDHDIIMWKRNYINGRFEDFIETSHRQDCTHDIQHLLISKKKHLFRARPSHQEFSDYVILAGGIDRNLVRFPLSKFSTYPAQIFYPIDHQTPCTMIPSIVDEDRTFNNLMLLQNQTSLQIWEFSPTNHPVNVLSRSRSSGIRAKKKQKINAVINKDLEGGKFMLEITPMGSKHDQFFIQASAVSLNGKYVACSDPHETKVYTLEYLPSREIRVGPISSAGNSKLPSGSKLKFYTNNNKDTSRTYLIIGGNDVQFYEIPELKLIKVIKLATLSQYENTKAMGESTNMEVTTSTNKSNNNFIVALATSLDGNWAAIGSTTGIHLINLNTLSHHATLPKFSEQHTILEFHPNSSALFVVLSDNTVWVYNVVEKNLHDWSAKSSHCLPPPLLASQYPIIGISFPYKHDVISFVAYTHRQIFVFHIQQNCWFRVEKYEPLMFCDFLTEDDMLVLEMDLVRSARNLPHPVELKRFNT